MKPTRFLILIIALLILSALLYFALLHMVGVVTDRDKTIADLSTQIISLEARNEALRVSHKWIPVLEVMLTDMASDEMNMITEIFPDNDTALIELGNQK